MSKHKLNHLVVDTTFGYCYGYFNGNINEPEVRLEPCQTCRMQFLLYDKCLTDRQMINKQRNPEIRLFPPRLMIRKF